MTRIEPLSRAELAEFEPFFQIVEQGMGFVPTSLFAMGRRPELLRAFAGLSGTILGPSRLEPELKSLVSFVASRAAGCSYCQAHTGHTARRNGASPEKIASSFEYETSPLFDPRERAALRLAHHAALVPNEATNAHFEDLRRHFDDETILEIVAVIALFGYLNRWNDTLATTLEDAPTAFAAETLGEAGWEPGKHA
ncbi:MAG: carboxymuconolactone decarboxylase family protein [Proteobacteria bacterium]|nr:carboxymuconolactone decarboxylase family protein [Pseudomonadota bacterium]